ncbi:MAG: ABC transporter substrate-binding protein [Saprospiraceae bacterium]
MTSAQNHLQLSNGNKFFVWICALVFMFSVSSCELLKPVQGGNNKDKNGELDPVTGKNKDNTNDDPDIVKEASKPNAPDTLNWTVVKPDNGGIVVIDPKDPNGDGGNDDPKNPTNEKGIPSGVKKEAYSMAVMLPLYTDKFKQTNSIPREVRRSLNFYEGVLLGLRRLEAEGLNMTVNVYDTKVNSMSSLGNVAEVQNADFILGPVNRTKVTQMATIAKTNGSIMLSMNSGENLASENPYYIQASPSDKKHAEAVVFYLKEKYANSKIVLLGRNEEAGAFVHYQTANTAINDSGVLLNEYLVSGSNVNYDIRSITDYLSKADTNIVVIPSTNTGFVKSMLRELSLLRRTYPIVVFGLPRWASESFNRSLDPDYLQKLHVHVSSSTYINRSNPNIQSFKLDYFNEYGLAPSDESYKGYDLALYFGRMLKEHGTDLLKHLDSNPKEALHSTLHFVPNYMPTIGMGEGDAAVNQFENKYVNILRFSNYQFVKMN